jgi:hypothetical protein
MTDELTAVRLSARVVMEGGLLLRAPRSHSYLPSVSRHLGALEGPLRAFDWSAAESDISIAQKRVVFSTSGTRPCCQSLTP